MEREAKLGDKKVGDGQPVFIVAELGINHNGDIEVAKQLIDLAKWAGADAVKLQKRTPELSVPDGMHDKMRETPWGYISYLDYRYKVEFGEKEYQEIADRCKDRGMGWYVSVWDRPSVDFMENFPTLAYKIPSPALTDHDLIRHARLTGKPLILSTGMSTMEQIRDAVSVAGQDNLILLHCTSTYPCEPEELNLRMIQTLKGEFPTVPVGYSGHEVGLVVSAAAVGLGASMIERHVTLDRSMWGSDQVASLEASGFQKLVKYIRVTEQALGDGVKRVYESERPAMKKQRRSKEDLAR